MHQLANQPLAWQPLTTAKDPGILGNKIGTKGTNPDRALKQWAVQVRAREEVSASPTSTSPSVVLLKDAADMRGHACAGLGNGKPA